MAGMDDFLRGHDDGVQRDDGGRVPREPETQRTARILDIIAKICGEPRRWTRQGLANAYEISERQITKDLQVIRHGLLFELDRQHGGGYFFKTLPQLPALSYSLSEALAVYLAAQAGRRTPGIPHDDLSAALARLTSIMPAEMRPLLSEWALAPAVPARSRRREAVLELLSRAIAGRRCVQLAYRPTGPDAERTERQVDPYAVVPMERSWYLIGWCHLRNAVRIFKVDRIEGIALGFESFMPDPEFSLNDFLDAGWGVTLGSGQAPEDVELLFSPTAGRWIDEGQWHSTQTTAWLPDGRLRFTVHVPVTEEFSRWVLRYGQDCEVLQPDHLKRWLVAQSEALVERYGASGPRDGRAGQQARAVADGMGG